MSFVRASKFRHIFGKSYPKENAFTNIQLTTESFDGVMVTANAKFLAFVTRAEGGGPFMVLPLEKFGRVELSSPKVEGHEKKVLVLAWNPFNDNLIASGDDGGTIKIFEIPDEGVKTTITKSVLSLKAHQRKVLLLTWHCSAENILYSASADNDIKIWNLETGDCVEETGLPNTVTSMSLNKDGSKLAISCKDKKFRILDARSLAIQAEWDGHSGAQPQFIQYANFGMLISTGFSRTSERELVAWNEKTQEKLGRMGMDTTNSPLHIYYDADLNVIFLTGKGDAAIRYYELDKEKPFLHYLSTHTEATSHKRIGCICKRAVNPTIKEIARFYRYDSKAIVVTSMIVPRKSDTFQDDIYPDTSSDVPALTTNEWLDGKNAEPNTMSFRSIFDSGKAAGPSTTKKALIGLKKSTKPGGGEGVEDEFTALQKEVKKLKSTVEALEARVKTLENK